MKTVLIALSSFLLISCICDDEERDEPKRKTIPSDQTTAVKDSEPESSDIFHPGNQNTASVESIN